MTHSAAAWSWTLSGLFVLAYGCGVAAEGHAWLAFLFGIDGGLFCAHAASAWLKV